jgi:ribonuclease HI
VIVGGDFNAHHTYWGCQTENSYGEWLLEKISNSNLSLMNDGKATRINRRNLNNSSVIDLTLISANLMSISNWNVDDDDLGSDHQCIKIECIFNNKQQKNFKTVLNLNDVIEDLNMINFENLDSMDTLIDSIKEKIKENKKNVENPFIPKPWWNDNIKKIKDSKIEAIRNFNKTPNVENIIIVNKLTAKLKFEIKRAKMKSWLEFLNKINPFTSIVEIWHAVQRIEGKRVKKKRIDVLDDLQKGKEFMDNYYLDEEVRLPKTLRNNCDNDLINLKELEEILKSRKNTAPGDDGITYELLRKMDGNLKEKLVEFINNIWKTGNVPDKLKKINVIAILKPNKSEEIRNLRPISLLPVVLKLMNTKVKKDLMFIVEKNNCLPRKSFGFRKTLSTTDAITFLTNEVKAAKRNNKHIAALFVDIKSAFDNVDVDKLTDILEKMKIPDQYCTWIYNILINRKTSVKIGNQQIIYNVCKGLPQGDILSPDLFNIYTREIHKLNSENVSIIQFADDVVICVKGSTKNDVKNTLTDTANKFVQILKDLKLKISVEKTVLMPFFMKDSEEIELRIGSLVVDKVDKHCWLGIVIDNNLKYGTFVRTIKHKIMKKLDILKKLTGTSWGGHPDTMSTLFKGIIRNQLEYGCVVYNSITKSYEDMIEVLIRKALRIVNGFTKSTPINAVHGISAESPHAIRREMLSEKYVIKTISNDNAISQQLQKNLKKEIEMIKDCDFMEIENKRIIINKNTDQLVCLKQKYSNCEYIFLQIWCDKIMDIQKIKNNCYKNLSESETKYPIIKTEIEEMIAKKSDYNPLELKTIALKSLEKYDHSKFIFTDASKKENECSIGIFFQNLNLNFAYKLNSSTSIMMAELYGIKEALKLAKQIKLNEPVILTDSVNSCYVIRKAKCSYKMYSVVKDIISLAKDAKAIIQWIPSHVNIGGNEKADQIAKKVINENLLVESINNKLIDKDFFNECNHKFIEKFQSWYSNISQIKGKVLYSVMPQINRYPWYKKSELTVNTIKMINRILSNHAYSPKFLKMIKINESDACEVCGVSADVEHIIFNCSKYNTTRENLRMNDCKNILELKQKFDNNFINKIADFIKNTKIKI